MVRSDKAFKLVPDLVNGFTRLVKAGFLLDMCLPVHICACMSACGASAVVDEDLTLQDKEMVRLLLEMKAGLDTVMDEAFARDERFGHALKDAFEHFVNQRANRCPVI